MKLISSSPAPQKSPLPRGRSSRLGRHLLSKVFFVRTAWRVLVVIVAIFAITVGRMFRQTIEMAPQ